MKALAALPANQGAAAMQRINIVVLNPLFLGLFLGTALLSLAAAAVSLLYWASPRSSLLLASGLLYLVGSFGVTVLFNVPLNEKLARLDAQSREAATHWSECVREWTRWNHTRTVASIASAVCAAGALAS